MTYDLETLASLDPDLHATLRVEVEAITARTRPHLVVLGDYSTGKTTLLKRLVAELGGRMPDVARVAASPTTDAVYEVEAGDFLLVDTPGLSSGEGGHDGRALEAAVTADALVIVLSPSLVTGEADDLRSLVTGEAWGTTPPPMRVLVSRSDQIGASPDIPDAFKGVIGEKRAEIARRWAGWGCPPPEVAFVAADPFGAVGDDPVESAADYAAQPWDGVPAAIAHLEALAVEAAQAATARRVVARRAGARVTELRNRAVACREAAGVCRRENPAPMRSRLAAAYGARESALARLLEEAVAGVKARIHAGGEVEGAELDAAVARLAPAIDAWAEESVLVLSDLAADSSDPTATWTVGAAVWAGTAPGASPDPWMRHADRIQQLLSKTGNYLDRDEAKIRANVDWLYDLVGRRARPWEKVKVSRGAKELGGAMKTVGPFVSEALTALDAVRQWAAETRDRARRAAADAMLEQAVQRLLNGILDGSDDTPGVRAWWKARDAELRGDGEKLDHLAKELSIRAEALEKGAIDLELWRAALVLGSAPQER